MTELEITVEQKARVAEQNRQDIIACQVNIRANGLVLARKLKENRDEAYYKLLGHDSFNEFLGSPEIGFKRSKAYDLIRIYELFSLKLGIPDADIVDIGNTKLLLIAPQLEESPELRDELLSKAKTLSKSDLRVEMGGREKRGTCPPKPAPVSLELGHLMTGELYEEFVKSSSCLVCGATPVDAHHFPRTRVRGGKYDIIPLCRKCHTAYHENPSGWTWENRQFWGEYFYNLIHG